MQNQNRSSTERLPISGFHAHVYFLHSQREQAVALRDAVSVRVPDARLGQVHDRPVVFHPRPMFQISFSPERFGELVPWLMLNRGELSIMIHPITGDVWKEHTDQSLWLGEPLPLDLDRLQAVSAAA